MRKTDRYYRPDGISLKRAAQEANRIAELLRKHKPDEVPAPVTLKEPKK